MIGPSGAGKSSFLRLLNLSARPTGGMLEILGVDTQTAKRRQLTLLRRRIGMIHQDFRLLPELDALDNIALPLRLHGQTAREARREAQAILGWLELRDRADAFPAQLSGGEQQRIAIGRALIGRPDLLLADEPTNALAEPQARRLLDLFQTLSRRGVTVIVATHNENLLRAYPNAAIALENGRLAELPEMARA